MRVGLKLTDTVDFILCLHSVPKTSVIEILLHKEQLLCIKYGQ